MQRVLKKLYQCITNAKTQRERERKEGARRGEYLQYGQVPKSHPR